MSYTVSASENKRGSCAEYETKSLLYLMNFRNDSDDIYYFVVDFFNDLTGMDRYAENLWDIQSKGAKNNSPAAIGKELVTLFKNYISDLSFANLILLLGGVSTTVRIDDSKEVFDITNIKDSALKKLKEGLISEATKKSYINNSQITDSNIDEFLKNVLFVVDTKAPEEYIKAIIKDHPAIMPENKILTAIFNEIRNAQSSLKNTSVEGVIIQTSDEVLHYCRHLTNNEIRLMTLNRIINRNPLEKNSIPPSFVPIYSSWVAERQKDMLDQCVQTLCKALFNKNAAKAFWDLFATIYSLVVANPSNDVETIYQGINPSIRNASPDFDALSLQYFIAVIKDGIQQ